YVSFTLASLNSNTARAKNCAPPLASGTLTIVEVPSSQLLFGDGIANCPDEIPRLSGCELQARESVFKYACGASAPRFPPSGIEMLSTGGYATLRTAVFR